METMTVPFEVGGVRFDVKNVPVETDPVRGSISIHGRDTDRIQRLVALEVIRWGIATPDSLKMLRRVIRLKAKDLAEFVGVRPEAVSTWENEKKAMPRYPWIVAAVLVLERLGVRGVSMEAVLQNVARPKPDHITLDLQAKSGGDEFGLESGAPG